MRIPQKIVFFNLSVLFFIGLFSPFLTAAAQTKKNDSKDSAVVAHSSVMPKVAQEVTIPVLMNKVESATTITVWVNDSGGHAKKVLVHLVGLMDGNNFDKTVTKKRMQCLGEHIATIHQLFLTRVDPAIFQKPLLPKEIEAGIQGIFPLPMACASLYPPMGGFAD